MNEDGSSSRNSLKAEWSLLIQSFISEDAKAPSPHKVAGLSLEFINEQIKDMSHQKQMLFHRIEAIKQQIEEAHVVIENLVLVGSGTEDVYDRIENLQSEGQKISQEIADLDHKLKKVRILQEAS